MLLCQEGPQAEHHSSAGQPGCFSVRRGPHAGCETQTNRHTTHASQLDEARGLAPWESRDTGWASGQVKSSLGRWYHHQDPITGHCDPCSPSLFLPANSSNVSCEAKQKWNSQEALQNTEDTGLPVLGFLFPSGQTAGPGKPSWCGAVLGWHTGRCFCPPKGCFSLTSRFQDFSQRHSYL